MLSSACLTKCDTRPGLAPCVMHGRGRARVVGAQRQRLFAQRVVGAPGVRNGGVGVAARPRLDAGVEVHRALDQQNLTNAIDETSTDTLSTKSPRPMYWSSSRRKLSRVSGRTTNFTP